MGDLFLGELELKPLLTFVLPAYNEGELIEGALERLESVANGDDERYEVLVVDDGSIDDTRLRALRYAFKNGHVRVIGYDRNVGKGFAMRMGFLRSSGDVVVFLDSDLDVDVRQVKQYGNALRQGDIVVGSKWHDESLAEMSVVRKFLSRGFNVLVKLLTGVKVSDTQTGIKAVRREAFADVFRRLSVKRFAFDVELLVAAQVLGLRIVELPVNVKISSRFRLTDVWRMFLDLLGIAYRLRVKKWYQRELS